MTDPIGISGTAWRKDFWDHLISRHPREEEYAKSTKNSSRWRGLAQQRIVIVQYLAATGVGVFIRGEKTTKDEETEVRLAPFAAALASQLGRDLVNHNVPKAFFQSRKSMNAKDRANWDAMADWLHDKANDYQAIVLRVLGGKV
jgi:hypothetical protein